MSSGYLKVLVPLNAFSENRPGMERANAYIPWYKNAFVLNLEFFCFFLDGISLKYEYLNPIVTHSNEKFPLPHKVLDFVFIWPKLSFKQNVAFCTLILGLMSKSWNSLLFINKINTSTWLYRNFILFYLYFILRY